MRTKLIYLICILFSISTLNAQENSLERTANCQQLLWNWADKDRDENFRKGLEEAYRLTKDRPKLFFKVWAKTHPKYANQPIASYFDESQVVKLKPNWRDQVSLKKLKRQLQKQLKADTKTLQAFCKQKGWPAKLKYQAKKHRLEIKLAKQWMPDLKAALSSQTSMQIYPVYTINELLGDSKTNKGPLLRLDSLWKTSGDLVSELPKLEKSIFEIGSLLEMRDYNDPFILLVKEEDTAQIMSYLSAYMAQAVLPKAEFLRSIYPIQKDQTTDAYYRLLGIKKNEEGIVLDASNLNRVYVQQKEWGAVLGFEMNPEASEKWAVLTRKNVGKVLAIAIDGQIYSYPVVNEVIPNGRVEISGDFQNQELKALKSKLVPQVLPLYWTIQN